MDLLGAFWLNTLNHPLTSKVNYVSPPSALVPPVLSKFLVEHVTGQSRLQTLVEPFFGWRNLGFPQFSTCLKTFLISVIRNLARDVLVGWVFNGLPLLHLTLWLFRDELHRQGFSSSVCKAVVGKTWASTTKVYQQCWKERVGWCAEEGVPNNAISAPKLAGFGVWLVWLSSQFVSTISLFQYFWKPIVIARLQIILSPLK